jgi:hypothetical protein
MASYSVIMAERRGAVGVEDAERIVGGAQMLSLMRRAGWLCAKVQGNRLTLFDYDECLGAWKRVCLEGVEALRAAATGTPLQSLNH